MEKSRVNWDERSTRYFLEECIEQICKRERRGGSFTPTGWKNIITKFNKKSAKSLDKKQLKNKYDSLRKEWKVWERLFSKETGISYDSVTHRILADDEWWDRKIEENAEYAKYRYNGIRFARELEIIYKDGAASGAKEFTTAARRQMPLGDDEDDVYRPVMDLEEGSGDSEEELPGATTGVSVDLDDINLTTNTQPSAPSGSGSVGKRKRGEGSRAGKKKKMSASKQIADSLSVIAAATKDRSQQLENLNQDVPMRYVVAELRKIPEIATDRDFIRRCYNMMLHDRCREMFVALLDDTDEVVDWLRYHAYNTPTWQEPPPK